MQRSGDSVWLYQGEHLADYGFGTQHPFGNDRMGVFIEQAREQGLLEQVTCKDPVSTQREQLELFHTPAYIDRLIEQSAHPDGYLDRGDTPAFAGVYEASCYVAGTVMDAGKALLSAQCRRAMVPIAGLHHARRHTAAGFCAVNDCGILIEWLFKSQQCHRVAYVDIDAHHGDGVYYEFEDDARLIFADMHEDGHYLYPGTGAADECGSNEAQGCKLNIPMKPGADDRDFTRAWPAVEALLYQYPPQLIILQCGADSIAGDPITDMAYSPQSHYTAASSLCRIANELCDGRLLALGGGGYNRSNIAAGWCAVLRAFIESE